jgi:transcriptional regulator with XRE-family HTH domain
MSCLKIRKHRKGVTTALPYRTDLINAAMGARRLTNKVVAKKAGVGVMTVSRIRNGKRTVSYMKLERVVEALGLTVAEIAEPQAFEWPAKASFMVRLTTPVESLESTVLKARVAQW